MLSTRLGRLDVMQWIGDMPLWKELSPGDRKISWISSGCVKRAKPETQTSSTSQLEKLTTSGSIASLTRSIASFEEPASMRTV